MADRFPQRDRRPMGEWFVATQPQPQAQSAVATLTKEQLVTHIRRVYQGLLQRNNKTLRPATIESIPKKVAHVVALLTEYLNEPITDSAKWFKDPAMAAAIEPALRDKYSNMNTLYSYVNAFSSFVTELHEAGQASYDARKAAYDLMIRFRKETNDVVKRPDHTPDDFRRNYVPLKVLYEKMQNVLKPAFNNLNREVATDAERQIIEDALMAQLNIVEPNARSALSDCAVTEAPDNSDRNSIYVPGSGRCILRIVKDDHVGAGRIPPESFELSDESSDMIRKSLKLFPRLFLFSDPDGIDPMSKGEYQRAMKRAFAVGDKKPGVQTIRKIIIINFHHRNGGNLPALRWLASRMRHDLKTALDYYLKSVDGRIPPPPYSLDPNAPPVGLIPAEQIQPADDPLEPGEDQPPMDEDDDDDPLPPPPPPPPQGSDPSDSVERGRNPAAKRQRGAVAGSSNNSKPLSTYALTRALKAYNTEEKQPTAATIRTQELYKDEQGRWQSKLHVKGG